MTFLLGIHGAHNASVALIDLEQGKLVGNLEVERITGNKNDDRMDEEIIGEILNLYDVKTDQIAGIAYGYSCNPFRETPATFDLSVRETSQVMFGKQLRAFLVPHHLSHAISCAIVSPNKRTLVITADGWGDNLNTCLFVIDKDSLNLDFKSLFAGYQHRAPAHMWESICTYNYKMAPLKGPGKLMALAAYGKPSTEWDEKILGYSALPILKKGDLEPLELGVDLSDSRDSESQNAAFALQEYTNKYLSGILSFSIRLAKNNAIEFDDIGFAGGLSLNIIATSYACRRMGISEISIPPFPNDSGLAVGNCIAAASSFYNITLQSIASDFNPYLGPPYSEDNYINAISKYDSEIDFRLLSDSEYVEQFAYDIFDRRVCFRFASCSESGPRALGNRSIFYDPSDPQGRDLLNDIKDREWYRPFAPMVLTEFADEVLTNPLYPSTYMTTSATISEKWLERLCVTAHVDKSCRPQLVCKKSTPVVHSLIKRFYTLSGIPAVVNTSFNIDGPIVETPTDAIATFLKARCQGKSLYLGQYKIVAK